MLTQEYLQEHGLTSLCGKYGIKATPHGEYANLVLLKYNQINSPMAEPIVQECRGLILDSDKDWAVVCRPFDKFFNYGEPNAASIDWESARVYEKLDGSLMSLYFYDGKWRVSSSGKPDAGGPMGNTSQTMGECFWQVWKGLGYELPHEMYVGWTFMFEFMTPWNQVVVRHEKPRIVNIGARSDNLRDIGDCIGGLAFGWEIVRQFDLTTADGILEAAAELKPLECEGYVVRDAFGHRVKVKSPAYVALHHMKDSFTRRRMVELLQANEGDEFLSYFPEFAEEYRQVKSRYDTAVMATEFVWNTFKDRDLTQKEFALSVQAQRTKAALFALRAGKFDSPKAFYNSMPADRLLAFLDS